MKQLTTPQMPVLIVDDSPQYASVLKRILAHVYNMKDVTIIDNPREAEAMIRENPERFGLLFVDYHFPTGDTGGDLLARLHDSALLNSKVAFLITSEPSVDSLKHARASGVAGVIAKPFDRDQLEKQLDKAQRALDAAEGAFSTDDD